MNIQWFLRKSDYLKAGLVASLLVLAACSTSLSGNAITRQGSLGCTGSTDDIRLCMTAVSHAQWVDAYTLGQLR